MHGVQATRGQGPSCGRSVGICNRGREGGRLWGRSCARVSGMQKDGVCGGEKVNAGQMRHAGQLVGGHSGYGMHPRGTPGPHPGDGADVHLE